MSKFQSKTDIIREIFDGDKLLTIYEIYAKYENKIDSEAERELTKYGEPRFKHNIRNILWYLTSKKEIVRIRKGFYKKK